MEIDTSKATVSAGAMHSWATLMGFSASSAGPGIRELGHGSSSGAERPRTLRKGSA